MAKKWSQAGQTFVTIATYHSKIGGKHDAATNFVDAANCFKKSDPKGKTKIKSSFIKEIILVNLDTYRISSYKTRGYYFFTRPSTVGIIGMLVLIEGWYYYSNPQTLKSFLSKSCVFCMTS
jgi:hypothetical protein